MRRWSSVLVHVRSLAVFADWAAVFLLTAIAACDGSSPPATPTPALESVKDCGAGWQPFTTAQPGDAYSPLVYQAGTLYYTSLKAQALFALPTNGGPPATLASVVTNELWIEGDHLLLSQGNLANQIYSVPLAGGTPQLVLDGGAGRTSPGPVLAHAFTAADFYWTETNVTSDAIPPTVWHQSRAGGTANQIGTITFQTPPNQTTTIQAYLTANRLALTADAILVANYDELAVALALGGGALASLALPSASPGLASEAELAGLDIQGAYWAVPGLGNDPGSVVLSPADGSPAQVLWAAEPFAASSVTQVTADGTGGWILVGNQIFDDQIDHMTVRSLDAAGASTLLGCSPGSLNTSFVSQPFAVAPDAVYVAAMNLSTNTSEIDRVAR
jgi:hypothetical protein